MNQRVNRTVMWNIKGSNIVHIIIHEAVFAHDVRVRFRTPDREMRYRLMLMVKVMLLLIRLKGQGKRNEIL